jgi:hypothetical protein
LNQEDDDSSYRSITNVQDDDRLTHMTLAQKAVYDPIADQVLFVGAPNAPANGANRLLRYDVAANKWSVVRVPETCPISCADDTNAINPVAREMYVTSTLNSSSVRRMNIDTGIWFAMPQPDSIGFYATEASAEYFPERDELLLLQMKRLGVWRRHSNKWTIMPAALTALGWRSAIARYNPVSHCVLIIGGADTTVAPTDFSHAVYRYDRNGALTRLKETPPSVKIYTNRSVVTLDPVSGDFLILQAVLGSTIHDFIGRIEFWKYNIERDQWNQLDECIIPSPTEWCMKNHAFTMAATPISRYGATMFIGGVGPRAKIYLYKHTAVPAVSQKAPFAPELRAASAATS